MGSNLIQRLGGAGKDLASAGHMLKLNVNHLPTHGTAMGTKVAVAFANIFVSAVETEILSRSKINWPLEWKTYIDDGFSLWDTEKLEIDQFISPGTVQPQNLRLKYQRKKQISLTLLSLKGRDLTSARTSARTKNRLNNIKTRISIPATLQAGKKGFIKLHLKKIFQTSNHTWVFEAIQIICSLRPGFRWAQLFFRPHREPVRRLNNLVN